jgi:hypothetical protein
MPFLVSAPCHVQALLKALRGLEIMSERFSGCCYALLLILCAVTPGFGAVFTSFNAAADIMCHFVQKSQSLKRMQHINGIPASSNTIFDASSTRPS